MKAGLLLIVVDHEDGEFVLVPVLVSLLQAPVLLHQDQVAGSELVVRDTEGVDGVAVGSVQTKNTTGFVLPIPVGHCYLGSSTREAVNVPDPPVEVLVIRLESQSSGRNVAMVNSGTGMAGDLLPLRLVVGSGVVLVERFWGQDLWTPGSS